ncbi:MAG: extracellular solute-binding protein [Actinomycetota bacterium]|nr:extracellular solute-binding protein [Actinomycetota bacterium]
MSGNIISSKDRRSLLLSIISIIFALLLLLSTVSCDLFNPVAETETGTEEEETGANGEGDQAGGEGLEAHITLWDCLGPKERLTLTENVNSFIAESGNIEIETRHFRSQEELEDQFEAASLAGAGPELLLLDFDGIQRLVPGSVVKEIIDEADYSLFLDGLVEISMYNSRNYMIPFRSFDFLTLFYNKDLIDEPPASFEEVIEYCKEVNDPASDTYGLLLNTGAADWIIPFIGGYGDWIVDYGTNSLTLDNQATVKTLEFLSYIYNEEKILPFNIEYGEINELFKNGNVHMIIDNIQLVDEYSEAGINTGITRIPRVWQGDRYPTPIISGLGFMINVNCYGNELAAVNDFIQYMISEEVQINWTSATDTFPVLKNIDRNGIIINNEIVYNAFQQAKICRGKPDKELIMVIRDAIRNNIESVLSGGVLPEDAALKIQEDALRLRSGDISIEETVEE